MKAIVKKYGRWNEGCNWQLESTAEKEIGKGFDSLEELAECAGFDYNPRYNECYSISADKLRMTVICTK